MRLCVCLFATHCCVCALGWVKCWAQIPSMGHQKQHRFMQTQVMKINKKHTQKHFGKCLNVHFCFKRLVGPWHWIKHDLMSAGWICIYLVNLKGGFFCLVMLFWVLTMPDVEFRYQTDGAHTYAVICMCASSHKHIHTNCQREELFTNIVVSDMHATAKRFDMDSLIEGDCDTSQRGLQITRIPSGCWLQIALFIQHILMFFNVLSINLITLREIYAYTKKMLLK